MKLNLIDPFNHKNNIGGKNTKAKQLQNMFRAIYYWLNQPADPPYLPQLFSLSLLFWYLFESIFRVEMRAWLSYFIYILEGTSQDGAYRTRGRSRGTDQGERIAETNQQKIKSTLQKYNIPMFF